MRSTIGAIILSIGLFGCASVIDRDAVPAATAQQNLAVDRCYERLDLGEFTSTREFMSCGLAAQKQFALDIKLSKMELYSAYEQRALIIADTYDRGDLTIDEFFDRLNTINRDYERTIIAAYSFERERRERVAMALNAFGQGVQNTDSAEPSSAVLRYSGGGRSTLTTSDGQRLNCYDSGGGQIRCQ